MEQRKLKKLLSEMSLREKIGQMIQLTGIYFDDDAVLTGEVGEDQPPQWVTQYAGSVQDYSSDSFGTGLFVSSGTG